MEGLSRKVYKGALWITLSRLVTQSVGFVVGMVLARLLTPTDYGTLALLSIFFAIAGSLASCGFGNALVQRKDAGDLEFNSVFYTSLVVALFVYALMFFAAPYIAQFYDTPVLCPVTRVSALQFILSAINSIQGAELSRKMLFDKQFKINMITCLVSAIFGVSLAYLGYGVWALVWSSLLTSISGIIASWTIVAWRPKLMYSFSTVRGLFSYGWKLSVSGLIHTTYMNLYGFLVGKVYTPADLAYVNKGRSMPNLLMSTIDGTILSVSFPALAKMQDDIPRLRSAMRRMIKCSTFIVFPALTGLAACARPMILLLYGDQWGPAIPYVLVACFSFALWPINSINTSAISAMGRPDVYLLLECIKKGVGVLIMLVSIRYGVMIFMLSMAFIMSPFGVFVNTFANGRLLGYRLGAQLADMLPSACLCVVMYGVVVLAQMGVRYAFNDLLPAPILMAISLVASFSVGATCYLGLAFVFRVDAMKEYCNALSQRLHGRIPFADKVVMKFSR